MRRMLIFVLAMLLSVPLVFAGDHITKTFTIDYTKSYGAKIDPISRDIVFGSTRITKNGSDVYSYNVDTGVLTQITNTAGSVNESYPVSYGDYICWEHKPGSGLDIALYNKKTKELKMIADTKNFELHPQILGDYVIWEVHRAPSVSRLEGYQISKGEKFIIKDQTLNNGHYNVLLGKNRVVYSSRKGREKYAIYLYDLETRKETQIIAKAASQFTCAMNDDYLIFVDCTSSNKKALDSNVGMLKGYSFADKKEFDIDENNSCVAMADIVGKNVIYRTYNEWNYDPLVMPTVQIKIANLDDTKNKTTIATQASNSPAISNNWVIFTADKKCKAYNLITKETIVLDENEIGCKASGDIVIKFGSSDSKLEGFILE